MFLVKLFERQSRPRVAYRQLFVFLRYGFLHGIVVTGIVHKYVIILIFFTWYLLADSDVSPYNIMPRYITSQLARRQLYPCKPQNLHFTFYCAITHLWICTIKHFMHVIDAPGFSVSNACRDL